LRKSASCEYNLTPKESDTPEENFRMKYLRGDLRGDLRRSEEI
jgi:hypothetical protein